MFPFLHESGVMARLEKSITGEAVDASEFPYHIPSTGRAGWAADSQAPLQNVKGEIIGVIGMVREITDQRHADDSLLAAKDAAEAANRAKSQFLANMSHELRTPMTAIMGFSDILMMSPEALPPEQQEFLQGIQRNSQALLRLIDDILDLSRIEADRLPVEKTDCALQEVIDDALSAVQTQAQGKGLSLDVDYQFPVPKTIYTDRARLRQILLNLLGNAIKFTERGGVRANVRWLPEGEGTRRMQFAVTDTGIGIPPDKLEEIFKPFVQVDGSVTRRYGGAGLGLTISQRLAKALGGSIEVTSQLGQGSTFTLTIDAGPMTRACMAGSQAEQSRSERPPAPPAPPVRGRVLFAEDDSGAQDVIRFYLKGVGVEVDTADNGHLACEMAEQSQAEGRPYDLILMDIQMPIMGGYEATRWLRQHGWRGPIVALTAFAMAGDREKCLAAGCDDYLTKPIAPQALKDVATRYLSALG
jgi:signal transduction histidine kinase/CheY-like chemotaxis protein